jgi:hypothetical protein
MMNIIVAGVALGHGCTDKTGGTLSIVFGILTMDIVLFIPGIILLSNTSKQEYCAQTVPRDSVDEEIIALRKQIELQKLRTEEKVINANKYNELEELKNN